VYVDAGEKYLCFSGVNWAERFWVSIVTGLLKKIRRAIFRHKKSLEITPGTYRLMKSVFAPRKWSLMDDLERYIGPKPWRRHKKAGPYPWD